MDLAVCFAIANDVDSLVDGFAHREFVGDVFARDIVASAVGWRCAHEFETCSDVYAFLGSESLERSEALVVIHSEHGIVVLEFARTKESVGSEWTYADDAFFVGCIDGWVDDFEFFGTKEAIVAGVRVETKHGNAWTDDSKVFFKRFVEKTEFLENAFGGDGLRDFGDREVGCDQSNAETVACENHKRLRTSTIFEIFGVAWEFEFIALDSGLVDWCCDDSIDFAIDEVESCGFEGFEGRFASLRGWLSEFDFRLFVRSVDDADFVRVDIIGRASNADSV